MHLINMKLAVVFLLGSLVAIAGSETDGDLRQIIVNGNNQFGFSMYQKVKEQSTAVFISPCSAEIVLSMLAFGARGMTFTEMTSVLKIPPNKHVIKNGFQSFLKVLLENANSIILNIANRIYVDSSIHLKSSYQTAIQKYFHADVLNIDFQTDPEVARLNINNWVAQSTSGKITQIIQPGVIHPSTSSILVSAIYFKGYWSSRFHPQFTTNDEFYITCNSVTLVPMMHQTYYYRYAAFSGFQALELLYKGGKYSMLILLPKCDGLDQIEPLMTVKNLKKINHNLKMTKVQVSLPRFTMEQTVNMNDILTELGMKTMFTSNADFYDMTHQNIYVTNVIQKTFVEVTEQGTEATGSTGITTSTIAVEHAIPEFKANRPFIVVIQHQRSDIVFLGRYTGP